MERVFHLVIGLDLLGVGMTLRLLERDSYRVS